MYEQYGKAAQFLIVYIREAHASESRRPVAVNNRWEIVETPKNIFERYQVANTCISDLNLSIPCVIDGMDDTTEKDYAAWPDRLFLVGQDGNMAFSGGRGPFGFKPNELELALVDELKKVGKFKDSWELVAQDVKGMRMGRPGGQKAGASGRSPGNQRFPRGQFPPRRGQGRTRPGAAPRQ